MITKEKKIFISQTSVLFLLSILTITLGGVIYILLRPAESIFFNWIRTIGLGNELTKLRELQFFITSVIPEWIIYSLPNGLWAFSYAAIITHIWWRSQSILKFFWIASIPILILGYEMLQLTAILSGTFCLQDLLFGLTGIVSGIYIGIITSK
jgi:hypothetical protein